MSSLSRTRRLLVPPVHEPRPEPALVALRDRQRGERYASLWLLHRGASAGYLRGGVPRCVAGRAERTATRPCDGGPAERILRRRLCLRHRLMRSTTAAPYAADPSAIQSGVTPRLPWLVALGGPGRLWAAVASRSRFAALLLQFPLILVPHRCTLATPRQVCLTRVVRPSLQW
jgi:hypothetical protein